MRYKYIFLVVIGLLVFSGLTILANLQDNSSPLKLIVKSDKKAYNLGEVVQLSFELKNESEKDAFISDVFGVGGGALTVHVSKDGKNFPEYNPGWGQVDFAPKTTVIKPNESINSNATVLWHNKPNAIKGESEEVIKDVGKRTLLTNYAFPEAGKYFIKAVYNKTLESEPIQVTIEEPVGEDLEVWNKIKDRDDVAFFIQMGYFRIPSYKTEEREKFLKEIEQIINQYPNSFYAQSLRESLDKFKADEAKRQELLQKIQNQKEKPQ